MLFRSGNAIKSDSIATKLSSSEMYNVLESATAICKEKHIEINFTSPGWVEEEKLRELNLAVPACGACLSNMAIAPNGEVIPCQSWLSSHVTLGNILNEKWKDIWHSHECASVRNRSVILNNVCQLRTFNK